MSVAWSFDLWPADGPQEVVARLHGEVAATVTFAAWPEHLVIQTIAWVGDPRLEVDLVEAILAGYATRPYRVTHSAVGRPETVAWYGSGPLADQAVVCGPVGLVAHYYDPASVVVFPDDVGELGVSVLADRDFCGLLGPDATFDQMRQILLGSTWLARVVALRRASRGGVLTQAEAEALHWLALTDDASAVRQFAAVQASCMFVDQPWRPSLRGVRAAIADPLAALDALGPRGALTGDGRPYRLDQARHNARLAWLWIAGNLAWMTDGYHAPGLEPVRTVGEGLRADMTADAARFDATRDRWLVSLVDRELDEGAPGLGSGAPMSLFDVTRFAVLRALRRPATPEDDDRRAWLVRSTEALVPRAEKSPVARALYGSAPDGVA